MKSLKWLVNQLDPLHLYIFLFVCFFIGNFIVLASILLQLFKPKYWEHIQGLCSKPTGLFYSKEWVEQIEDEEYLEEWEGDWESDYEPEHYVGSEGIQEDDDTVLRRYVLGWLSVSLWGTILTVISTIWVFFQRALLTSNVYVYFVIVTFVASIVWFKYIYQLVFNFPDNLLLKNTTQK